MGQAHRPGPDPVVEWRNRPNQHLAFAAGGGNRQATDSGAAQCHAAGALPVSGRGGTDIGKANFAGHRRNTFQPAGGIHVHHPGTGGSSRHVAAGRLGDARAVEIFHNRRALVGAHTLQAKRGHATMKVSGVSAVALDQYRAPYFSSLADR